MTLFCEGLTITEDFGSQRIVIRFFERPKKEIRDLIRSCLFRPDGDALTWVRKLDSNGRAATEWFKKEYGGDSDSTRNQEDARKVTGRVTAWR
jgi:hypothetical protein